MWNSDKELSTCGSMACIILLSLTRGIYSICNQQQHIRYRVTVSEGCILYEELPIYPIWHRSVSSKWLAAHSLPANNDISETVPSLKFNLFCSNYMYISFH